MLPKTSSEIESSPIIFANSTYLAVENKTYVHLSPQEKLEIGKKNEPRDEELPRLTRKNAMRMSPSPTRAPKFVEEIHANETIQLASEEIAEELEVHIFYLEIPRFRQI